MASPKPDLGKWIAKIPEHVVPLSKESTVALLHYERTANDAWNLLNYFDRNVGSANIKKKVFESHLRRLRSMVVLSLVEAFERFVKETAAVCIDQVGPHTIDDRLDGFKFVGSTFAPHFAAGSLGSSLCEGQTWLSCKQINERFRDILADPFEDKANFKMFPQRNDKADGWRLDPMEILWQLRHSITHNVGLITRSDAAKLRLLTKKPVSGNQLLSLSNGDVWYVKLFLDDTAKWMNNRVGQRLAMLLTTLHTADTSLFDPAGKAQEIADVFRIPVTVAGAASAPT